MHVLQHSWPHAGTEVGALPKNGSADLILVFGGRAELQQGDALRALAGAYPGAQVVGCSTAGEIAGTRVHDGTVQAAAIKFQKSRAVVVHLDLAQAETSEAAGRRLVSLLPPKDLVHVLVLSDGQRVNGSALVQGMTAVLPAHVQVTGGLAGDGASFQETVVVTGKEARSGRIAAVGLYGASLRAGCGSLGGWDAFGPARAITKSKDNVLFELDGQPALELYKTYLGEHAAGLPATGLLFPLEVQAAGSPRRLTRTLLGVDAAKGSMTFAGDMPTGATARLMKANFDRLVDGAHGAATRSHDPLGAAAELAILVSCVGRKLVLKQRTEEELEAVREVLGPKPAMCGFYSYGEICPSAPGASCELHNQTMTITTLREA